MLETETRWVRIPATQDTDACLELHARTPETGEFRPTTFHVQICDDGTYSVNESSPDGTAAGEAFVIFHETTRSMVAAQASASARFGAGPRARS